MLLLKGGNIVVIVAERTDDIRPLIKSDIQVRFGIIPLDQMQPSLAAIAVSRRIIRVQVYCADIILDGPKLVALAVVGNTAIVVGNGVPGIEFKGLGIIINGTLIVAFVMTSQTGTETDKGVAM